MQFLEKVKLFSKLFLQAPGAANSDPFLFIRSLFSFLHFRHKQSIAKMVISEIFC